MNSFEHKIIEDILLDTNNDKYISLIIESYIYQNIETYYSVNLSSKLKQINSLKEKYTTRFGKKHGLYKEFTKKGKLKFFCYFNNGLFDGEYKQYSRSGNQLMLDLLFKNDKLIEQKFSIYDKIFQLTNN